MVQLNAKLITCKNNQQSTFLIVDDGIVILCLYVEMVI